MKKTLLSVLIVCTFFSLSLAQNSFRQEQGGELPYFQNDKIELKNQIDVYPNPAVKNIFVKIENSELEKVEFELYNIIGTSLQFEKEEITRNHFKFSVEEFPPGYYLLIIKDPIQRFNKAFKFHKVK
ncbi:T9SS type A sorting domain-containing protein [Bacteroidota bacterium]